MEVCFVAYTSAVEDAEAWKERAACRGADTDLFFPAGRGGTKVRSEPALRICARCVVKDECLAYATSGMGMVAVGIWGGTTDAMRRKAEKGK